MSPHLLGPVQVRDVEAPLALARRGRAAARPPDPGRGARADARAPRRHRLRGGREGRGAHPARRDGARARLRRRGARRARHHPLGRDVGLRHRQRRPDPDARGPRPRRAAARRGAAPPARLRARAPRPARARLHALPAGAAHDGRQARRALGARTCSWTSSRCGPRAAGLRFLGAKGATGTQASFLLLFDGDSTKVEELDAALARRAGFARRQLVSGQTYSRKQDDAVVHALSGLAQSAHKIGTDLRLLQHDGELEEPFEAEQVGSSAMPYKRNPMRAERICALARHVIALSLDTAMTAATQWLERSLDDSANKRIAVPEAFLASDAILVLLENVFARPRRAPRGLAAAPARADPVPGDREPAHGGRATRRRPPGAAREAARARARVGRPAAREGGMPDLLERLAADARVRHAAARSSRPPRGRRSSSVAAPSRWRPSCGRSSTRRSKARPRFEPRRSAFEPPPLRLLGSASGSSPAGCAPSAAPTSAGPAAPPASSSSPASPAAAGLAAAGGRRAGWSEEGMASWYGGGDGFDGKPTASGEIYDASQMTAAHRELPLGTVVDVTNLDNGRSVRVRINDRGPFLKGRILDLSQEAARQLGVIGPGVARVRIDVVSPPSAPPTPGRAPARGPSRSAPSPSPTAPRVTPTASAPPGGPRIWSPTTASRASRSGPSRRARRRSAAWRARGRGLRRHRRSERRAALARLAGAPAAIGYRRRRTPASWSRSQLLIGRPEP